jgi:L-amino acid N-acyltransferase YncA
LPNTTAPSRDLRIATGSSRGRPTYLAPDHAGRGLGRHLLGALVTQAELAGVRKLIAVIGDSANAGSIGVHHALGFENVGVLKSCGWKFDRWLDVVLMEKVLGPGDSTPAV